MNPVKSRNIEKEVKLSATRSSGPGGQHVNKVNSRIQLRFNIKQSDMLDDREKEILLNKLRSQVTKAGEIIITAQTERSQIENKNYAMTKLLSLLENLLKPEKDRIPTRIPASVKNRRLEKKRKHGEKKVLRRKIS